MLKCVVEYAQTSKDCSLLSVQDFTKLKELTRSITIVTNNRKLRSLLIDCQDIINTIIDIQILVRTLSVIENEQARELILHEYLGQIESLTAQYKELDFNHLD